ncbi:MAG: hypothetical protein ACRD29_19625 [Acidimicrobiales bacterium]
MRGPWLAVVVIGAVVLAACSNGQRASGDKPETSSRPVPSTSVTTPATATGEQPEVIGYMGCSNTQQAIAGYADLGGTRFWPLDPDYGGTIGQYGDDKRHEFTFDRFDAMNHAQPVTAIWWQLCLNDDSRRTDDELLQAATVVIELVRERVGDAQIYVSPLAQYEPPAECKQVGEDGPQRLEAIADRLVAAGLAELGPALPPLTIDLLSDRCHLNDAGEKRHGHVLLDFFG